MVLPHSFTADYDVSQKTGRSPAPTGRPLRAICSMRNSLFSASAADAIEWWPSNRSSWTRCRGAHEQFPTLAMSHSVNGTVRALTPEEFGKLAAEAPTMT